MGHTATLPRQRHHIFMLQNICHCIRPPFLVATSFRYRDLNIFGIFSCRNVVVAKLKNCRVPTALITETRPFYPPTMEVLIYCRSIEGVILRRPSSGYSPECCANHWPSNHLRHISLRFMIKQLNTQNTYSISLKTGYLTLFWQT